VVRCRPHGGHLQRHDPHRPSLHLLRRLPRRLRLRPRRHPSVRLPALRDRLFPHALAARHCQRPALRHRRCGPAHGRQDCRRLRS
ncbi:hypothetical protein BN1723_020956, partial [Verticillium longisporum]